MGHSNESAEISPGETPMLSTGRASEHILLPEPLCMSSSYPCRGNPALLQQHLHLCPPSRPCSAKQSQQTRRRRIQGILLQFLCSPILCHVHAHQQAVGSAGIMQPHDSSASVLSPPVPLLLKANKVLKSPLKIAELWRNHQKELFSWYQSQHQGGSMQTNCYQTSPAFQLRHHWDPLVHALTHQSCCNGWVPIVFIPSQLMLREGGMGIILHGCAGAREQGAQQSSGDGIVLHMGFDGTVASFCVDHFYPLGSDPKD